MSSIQTGDIVISLAGHDAGKPFVVVAVVSDGFVLIADGKSRRIESPKLKRIRHLRVVAKGDVKNPTNAALNKCVKRYLQEKEVVCREVTISKPKA